MFLRNFKIYLAGLALLLVFSSTVFAHVEFIQPEEGDVLTGGSSFTIKWEIDEIVEPDSNFDIRFSEDNGLNWETVTTNLEFTVREFEWQVPNINTKQGLIELIEDRPEGEEDEGGRSETFTIEKVKSFTFSCEDVFKEWLFGLEILSMDIEEEQSCVLKLTNPEPDVEVKISTKLRDGIRSSIEVFPTSGITDANGELEFTLTAMDDGLGWISWAVPDANGTFSFDKEAYDIGNAWGMLVNVR